MTHSCSKCNFSAQFESALTMHNQLHHDCITLEKTRAKSPILHKHKPNIAQRWHGHVGNVQQKKDWMKLSTTSSATKLFDRLRAKVCKSRQTLFVHPEEPILERNGELPKLETQPPSDSERLVISNIKPSNKSAAKLAERECYACHICPFIADRITVLDRHLLNDHQIGLENLLKLVMAKTKEGLTERDNNDWNKLSRQPYYKPDDPIIEENEGKEFIIETLHPRVKIMKHVSSNTDLIWSDIVVYNKELEDIDAAEVPAVQDKDDLATKITTLNECMCQFVDSSNMLKRVLNSNELDSKHSIRGNRSNIDGPILDLALDDDGRRTQSDKLDKRYREKSNRSAKSSCASNIYYF